ncbi:MAG TPA: zinc-binding alcohol dehydrogenase family protein [Sulfuriferula sp.]|nr:zinc-binding alcohol dehydrogenase family protein [Sulfuriferula sp.]
MYAIQVDSLGSQSRYRYTTVDLPTAGPDEVLIKLEAIGVNPMEQTIRLGYFPTSLAVPFTPGSEGAGTVVEPRNGFKAGDRVFVLGGGQGIFRPGTYAEYVAANKDAVVPIPPDMSFEEAAAFGVATLTAWLVLHRTASVQRGETVLILGGSGAVGTMALQLAKRAGAYVIVTVGKQAKVEAAKELGADVVLLTDGQFASNLDGLGYDIDVIVDLIGDEYLGHALHLAKHNARIVMVGYSAGPRVSFNVIDVLKNELSVKGFNLFTANPIDIGAAMNDIMTAYAKGEIKVVVDRVFSLAAAEEATMYRLSRDVFGRVVLNP